MVANKLRTPFELQLLQAEKVIIESALIATESISYAAAALGVDEGFIRQRIDFLGIEVEEVEEPTVMPAPPLEQNDNLVGAFDGEGWSCTDCGAEGEAGTPEFHNKGCPTQPITMPSATRPTVVATRTTPVATPPVAVTPRPVAVVTPPAPVATPLVVAPIVIATPPVAPPIAPHPVVVSRSMSPPPVLSESDELTPTGRKKRAKKEATPEQKAKWAETMAKARAAKKPNNVISFTPSSAAPVTTPVAAPVAAQNRLPPGPYADPPPAPTFGPLHPESEPDYVPDADEVDDEGELAFCTCAETGPNKCNIHKFGGDGKIRQ
jgi:hypothetical protein